MPRSALLVFCLLALTGCRFNLWGHLQEKPTTREVTGTYRLDLAQSKERLQKMGYDQFDGWITLAQDGGFTAEQIPACCVHGWDETTYPFSGGYYRLSGTWEIVKTEAVYDVRLTLYRADLRGESPSYDKSSPDNRYSPREAPQELKVSILEGRPLYLGFAVFNGDFDHVIFSPKRD